MKNQKGIYILPAKTKIKIYYCDGRKITFLRESTYANELIDILETDMTDIDAIMYSAIDIDFNIGVKNPRFNFEKADKYVQTLNMFADKVEPLNFLISFLWKAEIENAINITERNSVQYKDSINRLVNNFKKFIKVFHDTRFYVGHYCHMDDVITHEGRVKELFEIDSSFLDYEFKEVYVTDLENLDKFAYPFTKCYFFDSVANFIAFLFINTMQKDYNLSECNYCHKLFVPKTKKKTRYCDRVQTEDSKTCKQLGPAERSELMKNLWCIDDYDKAIARNYKRLERKVDEISYMKQDLDFETYTTWLDKVKKAKEKFLKDEITDEEFLEIVYKLDNLGEDEN